MKAPSPRNVAHRKTTAAPASIAYRDGRKQLQTETLDWNQTGYHRALLEVKPRTCMRFLRRFFIRLSNFTTEGAPTSASMKRWPSILLAD